MDNNDSFEYTYSAPEQEEIRRIREKYLPREERVSKMEQIRRLDQSVTRKGTVVSLVLGILSSLVMGIGMCCCLVWMDVVWNGVSLFWLGIPVGIAGMVGMGCAYPLYKRVTEAERRRIAPEILRLTEELMRMSGA